MREVGRQWDPQWWPSDATLIFSTTMVFMVLKWPFTIKKKKIKY